MFTLNLRIRLPQATNISFSFFYVNFELRIDPPASSSIHAFCVCPSISISCLLSGLEENQSDEMKTIA